MQKSFAVIGLGRYGKNVAAELYKCGAEVMAIDDDPNVINAVADYVTYAVCADVCDENSMKQAGLSNMDCVVVAMSDKLEPSIMSVMVSKALGVPKVVAKAKDEMMGEILDRVGADVVIYPEKESAIRLSHKLVATGFLDYFDLDDNTSIIEINPRKEWVGKTLRELNLRKTYKTNVIAIKKNNDFTAALDPDEALKADEPLLILMEKENLKRFEK